MLMSKQEGASVQTSTQGAMQQSTAKKIPNSDLDGMGPLGNFGQREDSPTTPVGKSRNPNGKITEDSSHN